MSNDTAKTEEIHCPEFLKPRLRLFLSADIVGSTALKQSPLGDKIRYKQRTHWFSKIQGFYFEAQREFLEQCKILRDDPQDSGDFGELPRLWKTIGDEVLFTKLITDHRQIAQTLHCWMKSIERIRQFVKKGESRLDVKCCAWLAGFPFRNSEVAVGSKELETTDSNGDWFLASGRALEAYYKDNGEDQASMDFIGPSIDIGFRISQFCSNRKFVVSVDIAYILAISNPKKPILSEVFEIYFDGSHPLKGVFGGVNYPVFWLDLSDQDSVAKLEDKLSRNEKVNRDDLREYCSGFFATYSDYVFPPFIDSDKEPELLQKPGWYDEEHQKLVDSFSNASEANQDLEKSLTSELPEQTVDPNEPPKLVFPEPLDPAKIYEMLRRMNALNKPKG